MTNIYIKEGWAGKFLGGKLLLLHPTEQPRLIDLATTKNGDHLPRDEDGPIEMDLLGG